MTKSLRAALGNPLPWSIALGALAAALEISLPKPLEQMINMLGLAAQRPHCQHHRLDDRAGLFQLFARRRAAGRASGRVLAGHLSARMKRRIMSIIQQTKKDRGTGK